MWKYNNAIIKEGRSWTDSQGYQHPKNWASVWDTPTKKLKGLVWEDDPSPFDTRFYEGRDGDGKLIEKSLDDTLWVDEKGKAVIDEMTGKQGVSDGLKTSSIKLTKQTANNLLSHTDWMVVRAAEDSSKAVDSKYTTYRAAVRASCAAIEKKINDASDMSEFMALWDTPMKDNKPIGNAPIYDWPDVVE
ncbi:MAG TPA: hypothetical protein DCW74_00910 [Alteromonas australica]|uniref:Uncharacterized protein n=1 Tax=Alteromonas australica TaxID=589873 RepID=A0A350NZ11_9ALTE|nr:hypothetical protein [Alteromonas australica]